MSAALVDLAALVAFAVVGLLSHRGGVSADGLARDGLPLVAAWVGVSFALRTYRSGGTGRLLATWIVAVPLAVLVRALALGRHLGGEATFLGVSLAFTLAFLLAGRGVLAVVPLRRRRSRHLRSWSAPSSLRR